MRIRWLCSILVVLAVAARADFDPSQTTVVNPRVIVIVDSSNSMTEYPNPGPGDFPLSPTAAGGDYDCTSSTNPTCLSKFCGAKQALCETLTHTDPAQSISSHAAVGLATYYQYVLDLIRNDSRTSTCVYDVLEQSGKTRTFTSSVDWTGALTTKCLNTSPYTCTSDTKASFDMTQTNAPLKNVCSSGSYTTTLTKTAASPTGAVTGSSCYLFNYDSAKGYSYPRTITGGTAQCSGAYVSQTVQPPTTSLRYRVPVTGKCSPATSNDAVATFLAGVPSSTASWVYTYNVPDTAASTKACTADTATVAQTNCWSITPGSALPGNSSFPVHLYLNAPPTSVGLQAAYAWFNPAVPTTDAGISYPAAGASINGNTFSAATNYASPPTGTTKQWTTSTYAPSCTVGGHTYTSVGETWRITDGTSLKTMGFSAATTYAQANAAINLQTSELDKTPTIDTANSTYNCSATWPCDITYKGQGTASYQSNAVKHYTKDSNCTKSCTSANVGAATSGGYCSYGSKTTDGSTYYTKKPGSCASSFTATSATITAPQTLINDTTNFAVTLWPTDCGTGTSQCTFNNSGSPSLATKCPTVYRWDQTTALTSAQIDAACPAYKTAFSTSATYGAASTTNYTIYQDAYSSAAITAGSCAASVTLNNATDAATYKYGSGNATSLPSVTYPVTGGSASASATAQYAYMSSLTTPSYDSNGGWVRTARAPFDRGALTLNSGYASSTTPTAAPIYKANANPAYNTSAILDCKSFTNVATLTAGQVATDGFGGVATGAVQFVGLVATGANSCGTEGTAACYACQFTALAYEYQRYYNKCSWTATQAKYTASNETLCSYTREVYPQLSCQAQCSYAVTPSRYDWNTSNFKECNYTAVGEQLNTQAVSYSYSYTTQGGELFGTFVKPVTGVTPYCSDSSLTYNGATADSTNFRTACPSAFDCLPGTGTQCKLRTEAATGSGRYTSLLSLTTTSAGSYGYFSANTSNTNDPLNAGQLECLSGRTEDRGAGYADGATPTATTLQSLKANFCLAAGQSRSEEWRLVSDWYEPGRLESVGDVQGSGTWADAGLSWDTVNWSKPGTVNQDKVAGFSGTTALTPTAAQIFVPVPGDNFSATTQNDALRAALRKCVMPGPDAGVTSGSATWNTANTGVCLRQESDRTDPHWTPQTDYTPLYGSISNAKDYLASLIDADDNAACRDYYVILATDGMENTPKNYSSSDLVSLVGGFKNLVTPAGKTKTLKSYVIGFGTGAASDSATLDAMQAQGNVGLTQAYSATDIPTLKTALASIFSSITQGVYSRSKPTIATDGTRLYAGYYVKSANSPEWKGDLVAYTLDTSGGYREAWRYATKLDSTQTDAQRTITAATSYSASSQTAFTKPGSASLQAALTSTNSYDAGVIIDFVRNPDLHQTFPAANPVKYRTSRVGPVIRSSPVVVGRSPYDVTWGGSLVADRTAFQTYLSSTASRETRVLVGTDDGMLRAVREGNSSAYCTTGSGVSATDTLPQPVTDGLPDDGNASCPNGKEAWAFIPADQVPRLYTQLVPNGVPVGVDGLTAVTDICWTGNNAQGCAASDWKTVAIGTMRGGGRGMFALDVTDPSGPTYLWGYSDALLGYTYSTPAVGRVKVGSKDIFLAMFGGGKAATATWRQGVGIYMLNAMTGAPVAGSDLFSYKPFLYYQTTLGGGWNDFWANMLARPATYRQPNSEYLFSGYFPSTDGNLYASRFTNSASDNSQVGNPAAFAPFLIWDPSSNRSRYDVSGGQPALTRVALDSAGTTTSVPTYKLITPSTAADYDAWWQADTLPMGGGNQVKPLLNRPKVAAVLDSSGMLPDLFVGTGDLDAASTDPSYMFNYFVALHDSNLRDHAGRYDAQYMWGHYFLNPREQVVSEPAVVNGCIVVATFEPAAVGSVNDCAAPGSARLYGFDPASGKLNSCLVYTAGPSAWVGKSTPVIELGPVGIPSDLVVVNNQLYFSTSNGGLKSQKVVVTITGSGVRSYRRLQ